MALAARGARNLNGGGEPIADAAQRAAVSRQARRIHVRALLAGLVLTVLSFLTPE